MGRSHSISTLSVMITRHVFSIVFDIKQTSKYFAASDYRKQINNWLTLICERKNGSIQYCGAETFIPQLY